MDNVVITGPRTAAVRKMDKVNVDENISVFIRARPIDPNRGEKRSGIELDTYRKEVKIPERPSIKSDTPRVLTYDNVFTEQTSQEEVYAHVVDPLVDHVLAGYNCTVFAYGQTGTGKTYTMEGTRTEGTSWEEDDNRGIVPRAVGHLFEALDSSAIEANVSVSYMELYNENLYDLLASSEDLVKLNIYEDNVNKGKVKVGGLSELNVRKKEEIFEILAKGTKKRQTAATKLNSCSSRSHTIFVVTIRTKEINGLNEGEEVYRMGKLYLVDLAGSENVGRSGAIDKRAAEAGNINKSLLTLGRVIMSLVDKNSHVPYRESKLTRLLQDSLGGRTKTSIIATISPNASDFEDSISTLEYAARAKRITNKPEVNQKMAKNTVLKEMAVEIERLRRDLEAQRGGINSFFISRENYDTMQQTIEEQEAEMKAKELQIQLLLEEKDRINQLFEEKDKMLNEKVLVLEETEHKLAKTAITLTKTKESLKSVTQDCNEQKHLVSVRIETENQLTSQAKEILSVADVATSHLDTLHSKVGRLHGLEQENLSKVEQFVESFTQDMGSIQLELGNTIKQNPLSCSGKKIQSKLNEVDQSLKSVQQDFTQSDSQINGKIDEFNNFISDKQMVKLVEGNMSSSEALKSSLSDSTVHVSSFVGKSHENIICRLEELRDEIRQEKDQLESLLMKQSTKLSEQEKMFSDKMSSVSAFVSSLFQQQQQQIESEKNKLNQLVIHIQNHHISQQSRFEEMTLWLKQGSNLLSGLQESTSQALNEQIINVKEVVSDQKASLDLVASHRSLFSQQIDQVGQSFADVKNQGTDFVNQLDNVLMQKSQETDAMVHQIQKGVTDSKDQISHQLEQAKVMFVESVDNKLVEEKKMKDQLIVKTNERQMALNLLKETIKQNNELISQSMDLAQNHSDSSLKELGSEFFYLENKYQNLLTSVDATIKNEVVSLQMLKEEKLKRYVPTGETPQKTLMKYPVELAQTSPHERILRRFRGKDASLGGIVEDVSTDSTFRVDIENQPEVVESKATKGSSEKNRMKFGFDAAHGSKKIGDIITTITSPEPIGMGGDKSPLKTQSTN